MKLQTKPSRRKSNPLRVHWWLPPGPVNKAALTVIIIAAAVGGYFIYRVTHASSAYDAAILSDNPVAYWAMDNPSGSEPDLSGHDHTGTFKGGTPTLERMPNGDQAAKFNGSSEYMTVPASPSLSIPTTHQLTWEAWIDPSVLQFPTATNGYVDWMGKCQNYSPDCEWEARMYSTTNSQKRCNRISAYVFNPSAGLGSAADWQPDCNLLQSGQWLHVVAEYQTLTTPSGCDPAYPGSINIWVNGVPWNASYHAPTGCMSQFSVTPTAGSSPLDIGTMALDYWFSGAIGKVAIYNYLLSQTQINAHFTSMTGAAPSGSCANTCTIPAPTQTGPPTPSTTPSVIGDLNGDGKVNVFDLSILLNAWGTNSATADLNHDGSVNVFDLSILLSHWTG